MSKKMSGYKIIDGFNNQNKNGLQGAIAKIKAETKRNREAFNKKMLAKIKPDSLEARLLNDRVKKVGNALKH